MKKETIYRIIYCVIMLAVFGYGYTNANANGNAFWTIAMTIGMLIEMVVIYLELLEAGGCLEEENLKKEEG